MEQNLVIGIDRGNGCVKSSDCVKYLSGNSIEEIGTPAVGEGIYRVTYRDTTYVVGAEVNAINLNPLSNKDMLIQSFPAIARSIDKAVANGTVDEGSEVDIELVVGVPIDHFTIERQVGYMTYYAGKHQFQCDGTEYRINIKEVKVARQGYTPYVHKYMSLKEFRHLNIVDIGSGTIDIFEVENGKPVTSTFASIPLGTTHLISKVRNRFNMLNCGYLSDESIRAIISNEDPGFKVSDEMKKAVESEIIDYFGDLLTNKELSNKGYRWNKPIVWMGGGAQLLQGYITENFTDTKLVLNEFCNALAYKALAPRLGMK